MRWVSPARPQPCSSSLPPPSVYITESRSGQTRRPKRVMSSAVLPMTVIVALGAAASRPRRKRAAPMPPASTVIRMGLIILRGDDPPGPPAHGRASPPHIPPTGGLAKTARPRAPAEVRALQLHTVTSRQRREVFHGTYGASWTTRRPIPRSSLDLKQDTRV